MEVLMTLRKSFVKLCVLLLCLTIMTFNSPRGVNGQEAQQTKQLTETAEQYLIIEGDIQVSPSFYQQLLGTGGVPQAAPLKLPVNLWSNGVVPYEFDTNVTISNQTAMTNAMAAITAVANVSFSPCSNNHCSGDFVHIQSSSATNNSAVGRKGGKQDINITSWGFQFIIAHELLHCLGFFHEQSRADR